MSKYCFRCGTALENDVRFCENCGERIDGAEDGFQGNSKSDASAEYFAAESPVMVISEGAPYAVKSRKKVLIPIFIAAGLLLIGVAIFLIVYNANKASFLHSSMGDAEYTQSVLIGALENLKTTQLVNKVAEISEITTSSATGSFEVGDMCYSQNNSVGKAIQIADIVNKALGTDGLSFSLSASSELNLNYLEKLMKENGIVGVDLDEVLKSFDLDNQIKCTFDEKHSGDALECAVNCYNGNKSIAEAQFRYENDGTATLIFPELSSHGFSFDLPELFVDDTSDSVKKYDFSKLISEIKDSTKEVFEEFDYTHTLGEQVVCGIDFDGLTISIDIDNDGILELARATLEPCLEDEEFIEYLSQMFNIDSEYIEKNIERSISNIDNLLENSTNDSGFVTTVELYMNNNNTLAGMKFKAKSGNGDKFNNVIYFVSNGKDANARITINGNDIFMFIAEGKSASEGKAKIMFSSGYYGEKRTISVDYKNFGIVEMFGIPAIKGDFEISLNDNILNALGMRNSISSEMLGKAKLFISIAPKGKGSSTTVGVESNKIGKMSFTLEIDEASGEVAPKPNSSYNFNDITELDNDTRMMIVEDIQNGLEKKSEYGELITSLFVTEIGIVGDENILSADSAASTIRTQTIVFLTKMDAVKKTFICNGGGEMTVYVSNGKWITNGCGSFRKGSGTPATWCGGSDKNYDYCLFMADCLRDIKDATIHISFDGGTGGAVVGVSVVMGNPNYTGKLPRLDDWYENTYYFSGAKAGLDKDGIVIGTSPKITTYGSR